MASGNGKRWTVPDVDKDNLMIAMLVLPKHMELTRFRDDGRIDLGATCLAIIDGMVADECAISLGCYDASLEFEVYLALEEKEPTGDEQRPAEDPAPRRQKRSEVLEWESPVKM